jgi:hypothetical protein
LGVRNTVHTKPYVRDLQDARERDSMALCRHCGQPGDPKSLATHEQTCPKKPVQPDQIHNSGGGYRSDLSTVDPRGV